MVVEFPDPTSKRPERTFFILSIGRDINETDNVITKTKRKSMSGLKDAIHVRQFYRPYQNQKDWFGTDYMCNLKFT